MVDLLKAVIAGQSLSEDQSTLLMQMILRGEIPESQVVGFLIALQTKRETATEIIGFAKVLRQEMRHVTLPDAHAVDVCGTGGDASGTFNVSTCVAFVVAACGAKVAKHGNRAVSSRSGSSDVLDCLGVPQAKSGRDAEASISKSNLAFMFAPDFHPVLKNLALLRKSLGVRTVFNLLGPLLNPASVKRQLIGVYDEAYLEIIATALAGLGSEDAMVVHGAGGLDEISILGPTKIAHLRNSTVTCFEVTPEEFGMKRALKEDLLGGDAQTNATILESILAGETGPRHDVVVLNAGAALVVAGRVNSIGEGVAVAKEAISSGRAQDVLKQMREKTVLAKIKDAVEIRLNERNSLSLGEMRIKAQASRVPQAFCAQLGNKPAVIAEVKFSSPSQGSISANVNPVQVATAYLSAGAAALSILTEQDYFGGHLSYLKQVREAHPDSFLLMKDFVFDERQVLEARINGADAVLLIVAMLGEAKLRNLLSLVEDNGLTALVEVHDEDELKIAIDCGAKLIGINSRNLKTLQVDTTLFSRLSPLVPNSVTLVAESGLSNADEISRLSREGFSAFLIGTSLMKTGDPGLALSELKRGIA